MTMSVNHSFFNDEVLAALERSLSPDRINTYVNKAHGDKVLALQLYTWNTAISAAFYGPLQGLEVALRNAMHRELTIRYGDAWYDNPAAGLDAGGLQRLESAKTSLLRSKCLIGPSRVVAELPFGFWVSLLGRGGRAVPPDTGRKNYEMTLWRPALHRAFSHSRLNRRRAHQPLDYLRTFRNRIAHHEPIFNRHLEQDYHSILEVTGWICPKTAEWIRLYSRVPELLALDWKDGGVMF
ncbi:MAG: hypothetical protein M0Q95_19590 [Porticoccaceae bacterium]|nr:hypothetical protein [Porticoccaceae bacterium]